MYNFQNALTNIKQFRYGDGDGFRVSEDPTYLMFSLDFVFDPLFNESVGMYASPLLMGTADPSAPEADASAEMYLRARNLLPQLMRLNKFKQLLFNVSTKMPWYFQSIKGVDKLWANASNMAEGQKAREAVLEITTLEAIDLKMSYLAELYRKAVYDGVYMRELVPDNLRWFQLNLYVAEFRHITAFEGISDGTPDQILKANQDYFANNATFFKFECYQCEFDFSVSVPSGEYAVYGFDTPAANSFKINVGWFFDKHQFSFYDIMTDEGFAQHMDTYVNQAGSTVTASYKRDDANTLGGITGTTVAFNAAMMNILNNGLIGGAFPGL